MNTLRGFGFEYDAQAGVCRHFYISADGIKRWAHNDQPCITPNPKGATVTREALDERSGQGGQP